MAGGIEFPDQGPYPGLLPWAHSLGHWAARKVAPCLFMTRVFHCVDRTTFVCLSWQTLGLFPTGALLNNAVNTRVQDLIGTRLQISWGYTYRIGLSGSRGNCMFHTLRTCQTVFRRAAPFHSPVSSVG